MKTEFPSARLVRRGPNASVVRDLLDHAKETLFRELIERRSKVRFPFFHPATLEFDSEPGRRESVFTRDLSRSGVGLLSSRFLPSNIASVSITLDGREAVALPVRIVWCRPCGEGWYVSGGEFLDLID